VAGERVRRFRIYRPTPPEQHLATGAANPPDEVQLEGCVFSDGTVVEWLDDEDGKPLYRTMEPSPPEYVRAFRLLMDLDRCPHGRHSVDSCLMCPGGKSVGNSVARPGTVIGYTVGGHEIVLPDPLSEDWHDPAKWIRIVR